MLIVRPWRRQGRYVLLWSVGVFIATSYIIGGSANQTAEDAQVARESGRSAARPEGNAPSPGKSLLKQLFDGGSQQKTSETNVAIRTPTEPPAPPPPTQLMGTRYIKGNRVALRAGPGKEYKVLGRYNTGRAVVYLGEVTNGWSRYRDKRGRRCGKRCAHSKPGGAKPLCYARDVTAAMIEEYRGRR